MGKCVMFILLVMKEWVFGRFCRNFWQEEYCQRYVFMEKFLGNLVEKRVELFDFILGDFVQD